jgi:hypothetical protein
MNSDSSNFYNKGFGWICRRCEPDNSPPVSDQPSRLLTEGESEGKNPRLSTAALAHWADDTRQTLECPQCGMKESIATN